LDYQIGKHPKGPLLLYSCSKPETVIHFLIEFVYLLYLFVSKTRVKCTSKQSAAQQGRKTLTVACLKHKRLTER